MSLTYAVSTLLLHTCFIIFLLYIHYVDKEARKLLSLRKKNEGSVNSIWNNIWQMKEVGQAVARVGELEDHVASLKSTHTMLENSLAQSSHNIQTMTDSLQQSESKKILCYKTIVFSVLIAFPEPF